MNGADLIARFLAHKGLSQAYVLTGGACAFIIDAIARRPELEIVCFQHEQAAAMAADAVWRVARRPGVTVATSGPGATNLLTGIACSYFDSIPALHITGQVNQRESAAAAGARVRQLGFQETDIVAMAAPVTKRAVKVTSVAELRRELVACYALALSGRMGPVLIDVPMDVQQAPAEPWTEEELAPHTERRAPIEDPALFGVFEGASRPLVLLGAGVGLAGVEAQVSDWLARTGLPFVASWNALTSFDHSMPNFLGQVGVYGNRGANYVLQNCDRLLVLGSRLDNRQRSGDPSRYAPGARVHVVDIDPEELRKFGAQGYGTTTADLAGLPAALPRIRVAPIDPVWTHYTEDLKRRFHGQDLSARARANDAPSPYAVVQRLNGAMARNAVVVADCGANLCWVYQVFHRTAQTLFTAGGHSPMGYSLPAAIGAALTARDREIWCFIGDGGMQINLQELQTIRHLGLPIRIVILNNAGYGIIRQFQDSYMEGRHAASDEGVQPPDFGRLSAAYGLDHARVDRLDQLSDAFLARLRAAPRAVVVDVRLAANTLIEPKLEMGRPINDQFPYVSDEAYAAANPFVPLPRVRAAGR